MSLMERLELKAKEKGKIIYFLNKFIIFKLIYFEITLIYKLNFFFNIFNFKIDFLLFFLFFNNIFNKNNFNKNNF